MQLRLLLVPLLAAIPCSCKSSGSSEAPAPSEPVSSQPADPSAPSGAGPVAQDSGPLGGDVGRLSVQQQQGAYLAGEYVKSGDKMLDMGDLHGALKAYATALELDRDSTLAREKLHKVEALMGDQFAGAASFLQDATEQELVRRAQARMAAEDARMRAKNLLANGDYQGAIEQYRQAEMILRYNPLITTESLSERIVAGELEMAIRMAEDASRERDRKAMEAAQAAKDRREREEAEYRENKLRTLYAQANAAFLNENYEHAEALAAQILLDDPTNKAAAELRQTASDARHAKADEDNRQHYREQWIRTFEELDTMNVLQNETIEFHDLRRWADVSQRKPLEFSGLDGTNTADKQAVLAQLEAVRFEAKFVGPDGNGSSLEDIAAFMQTATGVNFVISPKVKSELDDEQRTIKLELPNRSARTVLDIIAETHEQLRWKIENGVVKFIVDAEMVGGQVLRTYEVRDLTRPIRDFPGKDINIAPSGGVQIAEEEKTEREWNVISNDDLEALIRGNVAQESWEKDPLNAIKNNGGTLVVNQTPEVHEQIAKLLEDLREATGIMVDIQARFLTVEDNFLEDIGVDFRGLGQPGQGTNSFFNDFGDPSTQQDLGNEIGQGTDLGAFYQDGGESGHSHELRTRVEQLYDTALGDENVLTGSGGLSFQWTYLNDLQLQLVLRAVSKSERVEIVTSPKLTVHNGARGNLAVLNQVAYVQDFNVEIAQAASIADPIVNVVQDGVILDVRPAVSADRRFITLELRPTIANLKRPIREQVTTLGSQNSVTIQLPEVDIQRVRTTIPMPDGGTVMLGGLKVTDRQDQHSGVPILNKIPIVSFFFDRKGNYVSNRKLLILLKANIVIPQEHEPTPAQLGTPTTASKP